MLFSDPIFLFLFLPTVIGLFYLVPVKFKNIILLLFSLVFYAWGERKMVLLLVLSSVIDYCSGILIEKKYRQVGLLFSIVFNLSILIYFKYANFIIENVNSVFSLANDPSKLNSINVIMPVGISFFTFQTMSYTIDVYRGKIKACTSFLNFITYVSLFPQLVAGPIVRYEEIQDQLVNKNLTVAKFSNGIERFVIGLFKKIFIANNLALVSDVAFESVNGYGSLFSWIGVLSYTLYIYFDVSGYTDMAIGLGRMFGFEFPENFNYPYLANSIRDFWRKWHITVSTWFRDYVYLPLGGNRKTSSRVLINLLIVFIVTGLWHGAAWNFVIWGLWHGLFLLLERKGFINIKNKNLKHLYVLLVVMVGWVIFRSNNLTQAMVISKQLFVYQPLVDDNILKFVFRVETLIAFFMAVLFSFPLYAKLKKEIKNQIKNQNVITLLKVSSLVLLMLICYTYISIGAYNPFIYFKF